MNFLYFAEGQRLIIEHFTTCENENINLKYKKIYIYNKVFLNTYKLI